MLCRLCVGMKQADGTFRKTRFQASLGNVISDSGPWYFFRSTYSPSMPDTTTTPRRLDARNLMPCLTRFVTRGNAHHCDALARYRGKDRIHSNGRLPHMPVRLGNTRWWLGLQHEHVDGRRRLTGRGCCRVLKTGLRARKEGYDARTQGLDACLGRIRRSSVPPADGERLLRWRESGKGRGGGTWGCKLLGGGYGGAGERAEKSSARRRRDFFGRRYSRGGLLERFVHCAYSALDVLRMACA